MAAPDSTWTSTAFDDAGWREGEGGFGTAGTPGTRIGTVWDTSDVWIRRRFVLPSRALTDPVLLVHHDEDTELFVNGVPVARLTGATSGYSVVHLTAAARAALRPGENLIAVHAHNTRGGQYIDVGLLDVIDR